MDLLLLAQNKLREHFPPNAVQVSTLLSIKQAIVLKIAAIAHSQDTIALTYNLKRKSKYKKRLSRPKKPKPAGSSRFCMGAAWKHPNDRDMPHVD